MRNLFFTASLLLLSVSHFSAFAQSDSTKKDVDYKPQIGGVVKVKYEQSLYSGDARFDVRNSRLGIHGNMSENMRYRMQIEFNNEGKLSVLDALVAYQLPLIASFSIGQQAYAFSSDLARNPAANIFANRTFVAKYITTYTDTLGKIRTLGSRDIGGLLTLNFSKWVPITFKAGIFNGAGINTPTWQNTINTSLKLEYGKPKGLQAAASYYFGDTPYGQDINMWGGELRYIHKKFTIDSEIAQRTYDGDHTLTAAFVQGLYKFDLKPNIFAKYVCPTLRWDIMDNGIYETATQKIKAQRLSAGANFGVTQKLFQGEVRINFEKYLLSDSPDKISNTELLHDKVTLELVVNFW